jgi:hypothetical protein
MQGGSRIASTQHRRTLLLAQAAAPNRARCSPRQPLLVLVLLESNAWIEISRPSSAPLLRPLPAPTQHRATPSLTRAAADPGRRHARHAAIPRHPCAGDVTPEATIHVVESAAAS